MRTRKPDDEEPPARFRCNASAHTFFFFSLLVFSRDLPGRPFQSRKAAKEKVASLAPVASSLAAHQLQ